MEPIMAGNRWEYKKVFFLFFPLFILAFILSIMSYLYLRRFATNAALEKGTALAGPVAISLDDGLDKVVHFGLLLSANSSVRKAIIAQEWQTAIDAMAPLKPFSQSYSIDRIFISDNEGTLMAESPALGTKGQNFAERDWYQGIIKSGGPYVSEAYKRAAVPQYNVVAVAIPIVGDDQLRKAIMVIQIKLDSFLAWTMSLNGLDGEVYIVDQKGHIVSHPKFDPQNELIEAKERFVAKLTSGERGADIIEDNLTGEKRYAVYEPVPRYGWGVIVERPLSKAFKERNEVLLMLLLFYSLLLISFGLMLTILMRTLKKMPFASRRTF